ncbi:MAG TPA: multiheme c-type cytochrome [Myxococcota bacterium]
MPEPMSPSSSRLLLVALLTLTMAAACTAPAGASPASTSMSTSAPAATTPPPATPSTATPLVGPPVFAAVPADKRLLLLVTASVQGYVEPCGCTGDPLGGIARLGGIVADARRVYGERVVFVDGGDLLFEKPDDTAAVDLCQAQARTELLVSTYARLGVAATVRGPLDDVRGEAFRAALLDKHKVASVGGRRVQRLVRDGIAVLIVGLDVADDAAKLDGIVAAEVANQPADVVVVLAQRDTKATRALAATLKGVDVVVVGRAGEAPAPPEKLGEVVVVNPGWQAQHVGVVELVLEGRSGREPLPLDDRAAVADGRKKLLDVRVAELDKLLAALEAGDTKTFQQGRRDRFAKERDDLAAQLATPSTPLPGPHIAVRALPLKRGLTEEPTAFAALKTYEAAIPSLVSSCEAGVVCAEPAADVPRYVGAATCQACHAAAWDFWNRALVDVSITKPDGTKTTHPSGHVKAWETLVHAGRDKDRSCVGCHSAGFDVEGGACTTTKLVELELTAVQCESCHGAGSAHVNGGGDKTKIARDVPEARCRECHLPPHIESAASFVYDERLLHILGDGHGAARRARLAPTSKKGP